MYIHISVDAAYYWVKVTISSIAFKKWSCFVQTYKICHLHSHWKYPKNWLLYFIVTLQQINNLFLQFNAAAFSALMAKQWSQAKPGSFKRDWTWLKVSACRCTLSWLVRTCILKVFRYTKPYNEAFFLHSTWKSKNTWKNELTEVGTFLVTWSTGWKTDGIAVSTIIFIYLLLSYCSNLKGAFFIPCQYVLLLL